MNFENMKCPEGGDPSEDCADCAYGGDYHLVGEECVRRSEDPSEMKFQAPQEAHK